MDRRMDSDRIAFIGIGKMGYPMAGRLALAGYSLAVHDINSDAAKRFAAEFTCRACSTAIEAAQGADIVITMLPDSDDVFTVVHGNESLPGIMSVLNPGATIIDMSSCNPLRSQELAGILEKHLITLVDAPVSGGVKKANDGTLSVMFGGSRESLDRCRPILEKIGASLYHTGAIGSGHAMKALNNYVSAAGLVATVEALRTGEKFGLDPDIITEVLNNSTGKNNTTENKVRQFMLPGTFNSGFSLHLMAKDIATAIDLAENMQIPVRLGHACFDIWKEAAKISDEATDHTEMYRLLDSK